MHKLIDYICDELEDLEHKVGTGEKLSMAEVEYMGVLAEAKKDLLKGENMMEDGYSGRDGRGYSRRGGRSYDGRVYYADGRSYERGRGSNARRDSMGRYSMDSESMITELHDMMNEAPDDRTRKEIQRLIDRMEMM